VALAAREAISYKRAQCASVMNGNFFQVIPILVMDMLSKLSGISRLDHCICRDKELKLCIQLFILIMIFCALNLHSSYMCGYFLIHFLNFNS
jgi:hypothetical protein